MPNNSKPDNKKTAINVVLCVLTMFILAYASFPLYNLLCKVTGYGGLPKTIGVTDSKTIGTRDITIRFNGDIMHDVPWKFYPVQDKVIVRTGENKLIFFEAQNESDESVTGIATYNIAPSQAAIYFNKIQCFCFSKQTLKAHEKVQMPVSFFVDPAIEKDPDIKNIKTITLSYTFFKAENTGKSK
jgi:cytochrome c oxidase assembly protein subunit 11